MAESFSTYYKPSELFRTFIYRSDIIFAFGLIVILSVMILPMPRFLLDVFLAISITFSVIILMTSLFIDRPLEFSSFPTILLVSTIMRLSLNVASTRLILSYGHEGPQAAGHVIYAFGNFMMGGNFVIGMIVFSILVIVNFIVITKGSGRIAEVSARFSLDGLPGKQMAIDSDLSAGLISDEDAKKRRKDLENESNFYGAMDGAAKFVRGDAIAGLLITFINIIAGMIIGMVQMGLSFDRAVKSYTLLTVGDGLVSQIPALIVSTAAGMLVSKSGLDQSTDKALVSQISAYPSALGMSSFLLCIMSLMPGIPLLLFVSLAGITGYGAYRLMMKESAIAATQQKAVDHVQQTKTDPSTDDPKAALKMDYIRLELGYGLLSLVSSTSDQKLTDQIKILRKKIASDMGFILPSVRIQDNLQMDSNQYTIHIKEIEAGKGNLQANLLLVMNPAGDTFDIPGQDAKEPAFGLKAKWISPDLKEEATKKGYTVVDPPTVITTHLAELIRENISELLTYEETQKLLDNLGESHKKLIGDMIPTQVSIGTLQRVLQNLLSERVSIRDLSAILEAISEVAGRSLHIMALTEHVRSRLSRQITYDNINDDDGKLTVLTLGGEWERIFQQGLIGEGDSQQLALQPRQLNGFVDMARESIAQAHRAGETPIILTNHIVRPYVHSLIQRFSSHTVVMSQNEIHPRVHIRNLGQIQHYEAAA